MAIEKIINVTAKTDGAEKDIKNVNAEIQKVDKSTTKLNKTNEELTSTLDKLTGGAVTKFKNFKNSLKGVSLGFKSVGAAIAASGIGLLVIVVASLIAAFKGSEEGQNRFAKLMGVIGAVVGNVIDVLADLGDFIIDLFSGDGDAMNKLKAFGKSIYDVIGLPIKNAIDIVKALGETLGALFSGDISQAFEELKNGVQEVKGNFNEAKDSIVGAKDALIDFAKQNIAEAKAAAKVADQRAKADKIERDLIVDKAQAERDIADLRLKARDLNNTTAKERETALKKVLEISDDLIKREKEVAVLRAKAQTAENTFARSNKENLTAEEEAKARVIQLETARLNQQRQIQRELTQAENAQAAEAKARLKEAEEARKAALEARKAEIGKPIETKMELKGLDMSPEILLAQSTADAMVQIETDKGIKLAELADAELLVAQYTAEGKREALEGYASALTSISGVLGQETAAGKALAVASSLINTYAAITGQLKAFSGVPVPGYAIAQAIATGVAGFANVKKILSVKVPNSGGSGSGGNAGASSQPSAPSFNVVGNSGASQLAQTINQDQEPVQAYVVGSDVTTQQEMDRNIVDTATIG